MNDIDPFEDAAEEAAVTEQGLAKLSGLLRSRKALTLDIERLEGELKAQQAALRRLDEVDFPETFDEAGVTAFAADGVRVTLREKLYASVPKTREAEVFRIVEDLGGGDIIKAEVRVPFDRGQGDRVQRLLDNLTEEGYPAHSTRTIHASTYAAWLREQREKGAPIDLETMGAHVRRYVDVKG